MMQFSRLTDFLKDRGEKNVMGLKEDLGAVANHLLVSNQLIHSHSFQRMRKYPVTLSLSKMWTKYFNWIRTEFPS
jgi:hypothetical protein